MISAMSHTPKSNTSWAVRLNRWALIWSRHYLKTLLIPLAIFIVLPFLAPTLMKIGATGPAEAIYAIYRPLCHTFAFRSWFLFGEQTIYPREKAGLGTALTYEAILPTIMAELKRLPPADSPIPPDQWYAREFLGDPKLGYKVAICQRDVAIYLGLFVGGLIYAIPRVRRQLRPVPIWLYLWLGLAPIGIDGFSQLLSGRLWELRESTPTFRVVTGLLFGLMNAWLAFPYLEEVARETRREIEAKFAKRAKRLGQKA
ncbi:MAG: hypothetical protein CUN49_02590 [Candidatus Thermofonsia Clade 1 bacterium]|jgi:uncharacterized membrane protein|uniref:DUF2085 domain-containing protein n=1 Tax=Candidatus Thermofonsia Clade 1 bacterium TaxID=2364210 RepID=A0A2M8PHF8_9CHLR|nr:MAG: hypothetical protein CUN49_02590 [Candidatus Thermofonsia Clade 1 bacterium]PJF43288.1 MAG: hypothetical protein CUN50_00900 [Candidatus Thermofonsia Clade 1 bacterium]